MTASRAGLLAVAAKLALAGGVLATLAGIVQATIGSHIADWTGNKAHPVALGVLTVGLGLTVVVVGRVLRSSSPSRTEALTASTLWLVVVALVGSTTVGKTWLAAGALMLAAAGCALAACGWHALRQVVATRWLRGLLGVLGGFELLMAVSAGPVTTLVAGIVGGVALIAAAITGRPGRRTVVVLLVGSTLLFVALTWWTIVTGLLTLVALAIGVAVTRRRPRSDDTGIGVLAVLR